MSKIIGIDLGTGNSCVAVYEGNEVKIIENSEGKRTTPSIVAFDKNGERKIGDPAKRQAVTNAENTIYHVKRLIGCKYDACEKDIKDATYTVKNVSGSPRIVVNDKEYSPQEISAMVLQKMKLTAEEYLGQEVTEAVITVPAYFNDDQRNATIEAGKIAGLEVKRIINEPTAAALAYGIGKSDKDMKIVVFDCGEGTHDVSILEFGGGVFEVLATGGDTHLGGKDVDQKIVDWIVNEFKSASGIDLSQDNMAMQRVREAAERAKIELSSTNQTEINLPYITADATGPKHFIKILSRSTFERLIDDFVKKTIEPCKETLNAAGLQTNDIDEIILVGGSTRIPAIQKAVSEFFGKEPNKSVNPDEAVATGAAIQGAILKGDDKVSDIILLDVTPLTLGIETMGGVMTKLIEANTTIPCRKSDIFSTAVDNQEGVEINVLQGNRTMAKDNKSLGVFRLEGIPMAPRGVPQIEVSFDIDANGVISVSAKDKATGKEQSIKIEAGSKLSDEEIERMRKEAEQYAAEDQKKYDEIKEINQGESYAYNVETLLKEEKVKEVCSQEEIDKVNEKLAILKAAVEERNAENVKEARKNLEEVYHPLSKKLYEEKQKGEGANASAGPSVDPSSNPFESAFKDNPFAKGFAGA